MKLSIGPGALVAAAFIGPGTVTACTMAGAGFGFALLWALVFSTLATMILQGMSARLGVSARLGLGEALMAGAPNPVLKLILRLLVLIALGAGNAAYEAGNLSGGALGFGAIFGESNEAEFKVVVLGISALAAAALLLGGYKLIEKVLIGLVLLMALAFAASAVLVRPDLGAMVKGLVPSIPENGLLTTIALIGTTIVPYNLFLHAAAARKRWADSSKDSLDEAVADTYVSIGLGGVISILVLSTAAASLFGQNMKVTSAVDMAAALEPAYGSLARYMIGIGLLSAGVTSAITAPLATAYALTEIFPAKDPKTAQMVFKGTALLTLLIGTGLAISGIKPVEIIMLAQIANGVLLPVIAGSLLFAMNQKSLLGDRVNGLGANILGGMVVLITVVLGARLVLKVAGVWP